MSKPHLFVNLAGILSANPLNFTCYLQALRIHQWLKNLLLFTPIIAAHQLDNWQVLKILFLAFYSFSFCASAVYIINDLLDIESDRQHSHKCMRPFASGVIPISMGGFLVPLLLLLSMLISLFVGPIFLHYLACYFFTTCAYSCGLKRWAYIDCIILALPYTLRMIAGAVAANIERSFWLLSFSVCLFLSLAFMKRYAELETQLLDRKQKIYGRGYYSTDACLVKILGIASGFAAILVLMLYINSNAILKLYRNPTVIWGAVPIISFWLSRMWMQAHRGNIHDDPLLFALKDKISLFAGLTFAVVITISSIG